MRVLVTGGAGFIGSHYVRGMLGAAWGGPSPSRVVVLDNLTYAGNLGNLASVSGDPRLTFVRGDIGDERLVRDLLTSVDVVVHFAAESHVDRSIGRAAPFVLTNVVGTNTLLEGARDVGIEKFVMVSTDEVYGSIEHGSWDENSPLQPNSPYAASKASADLLGRAFHRTHGVPVVVTRCSNNYGPYQHPEKMIPLFVTNLLDSRPVPLYGDGGNTRDWIHVDDHCRAIHLVLDRGSPGEIYNVGGGEEVTNRELTGRILDAMGLGWNMVQMVADRKGHDRRYSLSSRKIQTDLGFSPSVGLSSGLLLTIDWYRTSRPWWEPLKAGTHERRHAQGDAPRA